MGYEATMGHFSVEGPCYEVRGYDEYYDSDDPEGEAARTEVDAERVLNWQPIPYGAILGEIMQGYWRRMVKVQFRYVHCLSHKTGGHC